MFRKFSALAFLLVMAVVITLKHPVLGYCMCLDAYFTGDCSCQAASASSVDSASTTDQPKPCCTSCASKSASQVAEKPADVTSDSRSTATQPDPCDDCVKQLIVDVGCFHWQHSDDIPSDTEVLLPSMATVEKQTSKSPALFSPTTAIRGDPPPPDVVRYDLPLFLRLAVLRL